MDARGDRLMSHRVRAFMLEGAAICALVIPLWLLLFAIGGEFSR